MGYDLRVLDNLIQRCLWLEKKGKKFIHLEHLNNLLNQVAIALGLIISILAICIFLQCML